MVLTRRGAAFLASLLSIAASAALARTAVAKCVNYWVHLDPISTVDEADTCGALPCEVGLSLASNGALFTLLAVDPDGTERYINLREVDP